MAQESYVNCPSCDQPIPVQWNLQFVGFPDDIEPIMQLLEGTLNAVLCPACKQKVNLLFPLAAANSDLQSMIVVVPDAAKIEIEKQLPDLIKDWTVTYCKNYSELYFAMAPWINSMIAPVMNEVISGSLFDKPQAEQIAALSPLVLRIVKSQLDGKLLEHAIKFGPQTSDAKQKEYLQKIHTLVVSHLIRQLLDSAVRSREIPTLDSTLRERVPSICLTSEVLSEIVKDCLELTDPMKDPTGFRRGFLREYVNATLHSHSKASNPRGKFWAAYLVNVWLLGRNENVTLDTQFTLSSDTIRSTVRFQDLWDITVGGVSPTDIDEFKNTLSAVSEMFKEFGFEKELEGMFKTSPIRMTVAPGKELPAELFSKAFVETILNQYTFNDSIDKSVEIGEMVGGTIDSLIANGQLRAAALLGKDMLHRALEPKDYFAAMSIGVQAIRSMNAAEAYDLAAEFTGSLMELIQNNAIHENLGVHRPSLVRNFFNEVGNVFRYQNEYQGALQAYDLAEKIDALVPENQHDPHNLSVLSRNRAIVFRQMGQFRKAKEILDSELELHPDDRSIIHSLVTLEFQTNRFPQALSYLDRAIELTDETMDASERAEYLLTRGIVKRAIGDEAGGLFDLREAHKLSAANSSVRALRVAAAAMRFHSSDADALDFITNCLHLLIEELESKRQRSNPSLAVTIATSIAERYLDERRAQEVPKPVWTELDWFESLEARKPWEYYFILGWLYFELGRLDDCWQRFDTALDLLEQEVPSDESVSFAPSWMYDKEKFQQVVTQVAMSLIDRDLLPITELIRLYEFANAREIASRLNTHSSTEDIINAIRINSQTFHRPVDVFFPIAAESRIRICHLPSAPEKPIGLSEESWDKERVREIRDQTYLSLKRANPADLSVLDQELRDWEALGREIGRFVEKSVSVSSHVCFLPGRDLTGLPLHLLTMPCGKKLLETTTVTFAPNFATLLLTNKVSQPLTKSAGVVTVTKRHDSKRFRERALEASLRISEALRKSYGVVELSELDGTQKNVIEMMPKVNHIYFMCHGTFAGSGRGFGICVADEHQLPPSLFPIAEVPDLERFILTWDDFEEIERSPHLFVTIACSSGVTEVVAGGTRYGLEQTLFGKGTRVLISPLWDIDQNAALEWVTTFSQISAAGSSRSYVDIYKQTCLAMKERFDHPFFWGAFALNGSIFF